jgi:hypothetical protein
VLGKVRLGPLSVFSLNVHLSLFTTDPKYMKLSASSSLKSTRRDRQNRKKM